MTKCLTDPTNPITRALLDALYSLCDEPLEWLPFEVAIEALAVIHIADEDVLYKLGQLLLPYKWLYDPEFPETECRVVRFTEDGLIITDPSDINSNASACLVGDIQADMENWIDYITD